MTYGVARMGYAKGNVYGAEVGSRRMVKHTR